MACPGIKSPQNLQLQRICAKGGAALGWACRPPLICMIPAHSLSAPLPLKRQNSGHGSGCLRLHAGFPLPGKKRARTQRWLDPGFNLATTYSHRTYRPTTIGAEAFHFRVRNGTGWFHLALVTRGRCWESFGGCHRVPIPGLWGPEVVFGYRLMVIGYQGRSLALCMLFTINRELITDNRPACAGPPAPWHPYGGFSDSIHMHFLHFLSSRLA